MKIDLTGKVALVTASTGGIGFAIARGLAESGAEVIVNGRSVDSVNKGIQALQQVVPGVQVRAAIADLSSQEGVDELLRVATHVDILVNNAGIWLSGYVTEISPQDWDLVMNVNLKAICHLSQLFVNHCLQHDQMGSILNITSQAAFHGSTTGHAHYAASKAGLVAFAISLAREVAKQKINVNNIAVGIMDTAMIRKNIEQNPDYYVSRIPVGRVAQPQEIADIGVFMVSPKTSYMTGATLDVTGGMLMR